MPQKLLRYNGKTYSFPEDTTDQEAFAFLDRKGVAGAIQRGMEAKAPEQTVLERMLGRVGSETLGSVGMGPVSPPNPKAVAETARYTVPLAAAVYAPPVGIPAMMAMGAGSSAVGEAVSQAAEAEMRPREIAGAAIRGAAPVLPGGGAAKALANIGMAGAGGAIGGTVEGRVKGVGDVVKEAAYAASIPVAGELVGAVVRARGKRLGEMADVAQDIERIGPGVKATFGQARPQYAGVEQRVASRIGGSPELNEQFLAQNRAIEKALGATYGADAVNKSDVGRALGQSLGVSEVTALANQSEKLNNAKDILEAARTAGEREVAQKAVKDASDEFQNLIRQSSLKASQTFRPIQAGTKWEQAANDALGTFKARADELYAPSNAVADNPVFNTDAIADKALEALSKYPVRKDSEIARSLAPYLSPLEDIMNSRSPQSLTQLRQIRDTLYDFADADGKAMGSNAQRVLKGVAAEITNTINSQAKAAFGDAIGQSLLDANKFYSEVRPQFDFYGVREAFRTKEMPTGMMAVQAGQEGMSFGLEAPRIQNLVGLIEALNKAKVPGAPNPQPLFDDIRNYVVSKFRNPTTKAIDAPGLEKALDAIEEASPGSLSKLGLGNIDDIRAASKFAQEAPAALDKKGTETLRELLKKSPVATSIAIQSLKSLESQLEVMAKLSADALSNPTSRKALEQLRSRYLSDLLLEVGEKGNQPRLEAIMDLKYNKDLSNQARVILGDSLVDSLLDDIVPGYQRLQDYAKAAGQAGATVRGAGTEQVATGMVRGAAKAASGKVGQAATSIIGDWLNLGMYEAASRFLSKSVGSSGLRSKARFMSVLDENIRKAQNPAGTAIQRAIRGEPEK
jgi:hypothetical protein